VYPVASFGSEAVEDPLISAALATQLITARARNATINTEITRFAAFLHFCSMIKSF
jgi:hypothetical protein